MFSNPDFMISDPNNAGRPISGPSEYLEKFLGFQDSDETGIRFVPFFLIILIILAFVFFGRLVRKILY